MNMSTTCVLPHLVTNNIPSKKILLTLISPHNFHVYFTEIPHVSLWFHMDHTLNISFHMDLEQFVSDWTCIIQILKS
jgi:hypothetical protein